jgi:hypothetical protein
VPGRLASWNSYWRRILDPAQSLHRLVLRRTSSAEPVKSDGPITGLVLQGASLFLQKTSLFPFDPDFVGKPRQVRFFPETAALGQSLGLGRSRNRGRFLFCSALKCICSLCTNSHGTNSRFSRCLTGLMGEQNVGGCTDCSGGLPVSGGLRKWSQPSCCRRQLARPARVRHPTYPIILRAAAPEIGRPARCRTASSLGGRWRPASFRLRDRSFSIAISR